MLVDEVGASLEAGKLRSAVEQAQKFTFTSDIIEAAQMMAPKITHEDMAQFSRLPFSTCWFELPDDGGPYKKTGFLLMAVDHNHRPAAFQTLRSIDPMLERAVLVRSFGLAREDNGIDSEDFGITFSNGRVGASKGGCMNDAKWLLGLMLILNTKNLIEQTEVDVSRLNKQRKRRGKRPLFSYHVCRVRRSLASSSTTDGSHFEAGVRAHLVRGHLKARKTGLFWWSPHARGDIRLSVVHKEYRV